MARHISGVFGVVLAVACLLAGCKSAPTAPPATTPPREVVEAFNTNIAGFDRLWSRATVELTTYENDEKRHLQGEGHLVLVLPMNSALSIGKVGVDGAWVGSDATRYWFFDLYRDPKAACFGRHARLSEHGRSPWAVPVTPRDLPALMGMLPVDLATAKLARAASGNPIATSGDGRIQMTFDARSGRPIRTRLLDARGDTALLADLSDHERVRTEGKSPGDWPWLATRIEITSPARRGRMVLHLSAIEDGRKFDRIKDRVFDFEVLKKLHKPQRVIDLDARLPAKQPGG